MLFNPFKIISGWTSFFIGLTIIAITSLIAFLGNINLDGILDLHIGQRASVFFSFAEGLIDWLSIAFFTLISGLVFSKSTIRLVNVFGMQALARFPYLLATILTLFLFSDKIGRYIEWELLAKGNSVSIGVGDIVSFAFLILSMFTILVWSCVLMYRAYSLSCSIKGTKGVLSFITCMILAEVVSKVIITILYNKIYL